MIFSILSEFRITFLFRIVILIKFSHRYAPDFKSFVHLLGYSSYAFTANILIQLPHLQFTMITYLNWISLATIFLWLDSTSSFRKSGIHLLPRSLNNCFSSQCLLSIMSDSLWKSAQSQKWTSISNIERCSNITTKYFSLLADYYIFTCYFIFIFVSPFALSLERTRSV